MIIVSSDVTDSKVAPFIVADHFQTNPDGSVSIVLGDGSFAGQEVNQYGVRHDSTAADGPGAYQKWNPPSGNLISVLTRAGDLAFTYTFVEVKAYL